MRQSEAVRIQRLQQSVEEKDRAIESLQKRVQMSEARSQQTISGLQTELRESQRSSLLCEEYQRAIKDKEAEMERMADDHGRRLKNLKEEFGEALSKQSKEFEQRISEMRERSRAEKENDNAKVNELQKANEVCESRERQRAL
jgi:glycerol-3-phosphate O-acyltransferase